METVSNVASFNFTVITTLIEENFSIFILTTSDNKTLAIFPTKKRLFFVSLFFNALLSGFE